MNTELVVLGVSVVGAALVYILSGQDRALARIKQRSEIVADLDPGSGARAKMEADLARAVEEFCGRGLSHAATARTAAGVAWFPVFYLGTMFMADASWSQYADLLRRGLGAALVGLSLGCLLLWPWAHFQVRRAERERLAMSDSAARSERPVDCHEEQIATMDES